MAKKQAGAESGGTTNEDCVGSVGANGLRHGLQGGTLANARLNFSTILESGKEPTGVLLAMLWSAAETLIQRGEAKLLVGDGGVAILLNANYDKDKGLVER